MLAFPVFPPGVGPEGPAGAGQQTHTRPVQVLRGIQGEEKVTTPLACPYRGGMQYFNDYTVIHSDI